MTLSKRELNIAIGAGAIVALFVGYTMLLSPYLASRARLIEDTKTVQDRYDREIHLINAQPKVAADWKTLLASDLKTDPAPAMVKAQITLQDAASAARFNLQTVKADAPRQAGDFQQIRFHIAFTSSTASLYRFLGTLESSAIPLKIEDLRINSKKPGVDDLNVTLSVSTIIFSPPPSASRPASAVPSTGDI